MRPTKPRIGVILDSQELKDRLEAEAKSQGRSVNNLINRILDHYLSQKINQENQK